MTGYAAGVRVCVFLLTCFFLTFGHFLAGWISRVSFVTFLTQTDPGSFFLLCAFSFCFQNEMRELKLGVVEKITQQKVDVEARKY